MGDIPFVQTVRGRVPADQLGRALVHEHILVDFVGAEGFSRERYDVDDAFRVMLPFLQQLKEQGFSAFIECTPMYLGRDPVLASRLSEVSGLHILVNTGLYAAGQKGDQMEPYLPRYAWELSAEQLSGGWLKEWYEGIEGTSVKPGFIKIGVNPGPLRPLSRKVVRAAAQTSRQIGLAIACHTGKGVAALEALEILESERVAPERFIFVHAQSEDDPELHWRCAKLGAWLEYDGVGPKTAERHLALVVQMLERGFEDQILISQDAGWYRPGEPGGGEVRGFDYLWTEFVPALKERGASDATIDHLLTHNPAQAFGIA